MENIVYTMPNKKVSIKLGKDVSDYELFLCLKTLYLSSGFSLNSWKEFVMEQARDYYLEE
jgi:hypothetical protein